jgi:hypothetical protein
MSSEFDFGSSLDGLMVMERLSLSRQGSKVKMGRLRPTGEDIE